MTPRRELFVISALLLFLELAMIRWFPAHVLFLTFFTNVVLLACFLGMSVGCLTHQHRRDYLAGTPYLLLAGLVAGASMEALRMTLEKVVHFGSRSSPQLVFFGAEYRAADLATFAIPIEVVAGGMFLLVALVMVGPGQVLGRCLAQAANPLEAYAINIGGSLAGVLLFAACSWWLPPWWWFALVALGLAYFLGRKGRRKLAVAACGLAPAIVWLPEQLGVGAIQQQFPDTYWSPYYRVNYAPPPARSIVVNLLGHQAMSSHRDPFPAYALPYLINRDSGGTPFQDILIIGAGSGNDVSRALVWAHPGARVDTVEIDPVILALGRRDHPDRPYEDPRVRVALDDGRNFLRSAAKSYDLIVFALVDSLVLHSSMSNLRLESYLFTREAFADVQRHLKPDGLFVMYNYFRQGWIVSRLAKTLDDVFHEPPLVLSLPNRAQIRAGEQADGFTIFFAGPRSGQVAQAFAARGEYAIPRGVTPGPPLPNGFEKPGPAEALRFTPTQVERPADLRIATDDWPFLYLREPAIPALLLRGMALMAAVAGGLLVLFLGMNRQDGWRPFEGRMFFLGAGFLLIETKAVVHMALLFGSTWIVNTVVFAALLVMVLAANLYVLRRPSASLTPYYAGLFVTLALNVLIPLETFLGLPKAWQIGASTLLVFSPILFAGLVFSTCFRRVTNPGRALGYNVAGAVAGGLAEYSSLLLGFQYLTGVAAALYLLSALWIRRDQPARPAIG